MRFADAGDLPRQIERVLRFDYARVARYLRMLRADRPATIHRLRIAFKQYRYLCELLQPLSAHVQVPDPGTMPQFQARMGAVQDCEVMLTALVEAEATGALGPAETASLRRRFENQRSRAIKSFLDKADKLRKFRAQPLMKGKRL